MTACRGGRCSSLKRANEKSNAKSRSSKTEETFCPAWVEKTTPRGSHGVGLECRRVRCESLEVIASVPHHASYMWYGSSRKAGATALFSDTHVQVRISHSSRRRISLPFTLRRTKGQRERVGRERAVLDVSPARALWVSSGQPLLCTLLLCTTSPHSCAYKKILCKDRKWNLLSLCAPLPRLGGTAAYLGVRMIAASLKTILRGVGIKLTAPTAIPLAPPRLINTW